MKAWPRCGAEAELAYCLRTFVQDYFHLWSENHTWDSASETARSRSGDCSEHAVLLAALLRGHGIPARIAYGVVYVEGISGAGDTFTGHALTQALMDGVWVDLDATRSSDIPHAAYVLLGVSSLEDWQEASKSIGDVITQLMGARIEILQVTH